MKLLLRVRKRFEAPGPPDWPAWRYDEAIVNHYTPDIAKVIARASGINETVAAIKRTFGSLGIQVEKVEYPSNSNGIQLNKAPAPNGPHAVAGQISSQIVNSNMSIDPKALEAIVAQIYGDGYMIGTHAAANVMGPNGPGAVAFLTGLESEIDWDSWVPGNPRATLRIADGGLRTMLAAAGHTIRGINRTTLDRIGLIIARGLLAGDANTVIQEAVRQYVRNPVRAEMIARTEVARAVTRATEDTYVQAGLKQWAWLVAPNACPICIGNGAGGPYPLGGGPYMPAHPRCRCAMLPVINY